MAITQEQLKTIRQELDSLKRAPATSGNGELSLKQTIIALAPALERMKKRGFEPSEIVQKLHEKGIEIKAQTLAKYLAEARRQKEERKNKRQAANPHCSAPSPQGGSRTPDEPATAAPATACRNVGPQAADTPPRQPQKAPSDKLRGLQHSAWDEDEDFGKNVDYSHYGKFKIIPDTPIGEL